jgi:hypothetical protein
MVGMTFDELKSLLREWYEAGREWQVNGPAFEAYLDATKKLKTYARTLCEGGKAEVTE